MSSGQEMDNTLFCCIKQAENKSRLRKIEHFLKSSSLCTTWIELAQRGTCMRFRGNDYLNSLLPDTDVVCI